jgi:hypothetical protein
MPGSTVRLRIKVFFCVRRVAAVDFPMRDLNTFSTLNRLEVFRTPLLQGAQALVGLHMASTYLRSTPSLYSFARSVQKQCWTLREAGVKVHACVKRKVLRIPDEIDEGMSLGVTVYCTMRYVNLMAFVVAEGGRGE